jgi:D-inositol-3-phosphate glycosyltransferase
MRIAVVAASWEVDAEEHRSHIVELASMLSRHDHEVTLYIRRSSASPRTRERPKGGYTVVRVPTGPRALLTETALLPHLDEFARFLSNEWGHRPPDVAHLHGWVSGLAVSTLHVPVVQSFHDDAAHRSRRRTNLERLMALSADRVTATSHREARSLVRIGVRRTRTVVVPRAVDTELFRPDGPIAPRGDHPRLLALGDVTSHSGLDTAISALPQVPGAELVITGRVGHPEPSQDPELRKLVTLAQEMGVDDRVRFTGAVPIAKLPVLLRSANMVMCVPWFESNGSAVVRAMACGAPVIATSVGALTDIVDDGVTGRLVPPRDPRRLGSAVNGLLADSTRRETFSVTGCDHAFSRYSWDRILRETLAVYQEAVTNPMNARQGVPPS